MRHNATDYDGMVGVGRYALSLRSWCAHVYDDGYPKAVIQSDEQLLFSS